MCKFTVMMSAQKVAHLFANCLVKSTFQRGNVEIQQLKVCLNPVQGKHGILDSMSEE